MRALIIAHGEPPSRQLIRKLKAEADIVIATDGAANQLLPAGIIPHFVLGDFDSIDPGIPDAYPEIRFVIAANQEASDLDKAVAHALELGAAEVAVTGSGGGRLDHTLANASLLLKYEGVRLTLADDRGVSRGVSGDAEFNGAIGDTLSLIAFSPANVAWTEGLKWPLQDETLVPGTRGVSNIFTQPTARIRVDSGAVIACHLSASRADSW